MKPILPAVLCLGFAASFTPPAIAQPAANASGARQVVSPDVAADHRVTFRLYAPRAEVVALTGDLIPNNTRLAKDEATGIWSHTTAPLAPGIYGYHFTVDGVRYGDPGNLFTYAGARFLKSYVEVKGDGTEFWAQRQVPHGQLHEIWYENPTLGTRRFLVYTPPGYDPAGSRMYPAVYLYSGSGDNETYWSKIGRAHVIMDNLIADGKAKPALVVMPYGSTVVPSPPDGQEDTADGVYSVKAIERDLIGSVIPEVEKHFKVGREPKDRAIFGFSMGGYLAPTIGLNNPQVFGWVAGSSNSPRGAGLPATNFKPLESTLELAKRNLRYIGIMSGTAPGEAGNVNPSKSVADHLTGLGLQVDWNPIQGGLHSWLSWRGYFRDLMANKFFVENPHATPKVGTTSAPAAASP
jgi:enterochelin esterase-like enzyme